MLSYTHWRENDAQVKDLDYKKYSTLPDDATIARAQAGLEKSGAVVHVVNNKAEALAAVQKLIAAKPGASVMNAGSTTLTEIGYTEWLKTEPAGIDNLHNNILAEKDQNVAAELRRKSVTADIFVTSVTAIAETGEITAVDLTGSRVGAFNFAAGQLVVVAGAQKIVPTIADAHTRETEYCLPLESARVRVAYGVPASKINNSVTITGANPWGAPGRVQVIIVKEVLGF